MRVYAHACMSTCVCRLASSETRAQNQNLRANVYIFIVCFLCDLLQLVNPVLGIS